MSDIDFVLDPFGGDNIDRLLKVIKKGGTIISIVTGQSEPVAEKAKEKGLTGKFCLVQSSGEDMKEMAALLQKGIVKSQVSEVFQFEEMAKAHLQLESGRTVSKIVVVTEP